MKLKEMNVDMKKELPLIKEGRKGLMADNWWWTDVLTSSSTFKPGSVPRLTNMAGARNKNKQPALYICGSCKNSIGNDDDSVECDRCGEWVHADNQCCGLSNIQYS
ncbi:hypothetical protein Pcinc_006314 [Petrolisthes cinctipes]|uniref:Uncharacterized protein n=1 Tax=Petrolisthes cinctipes TaxID=88211 RepID=A0AAE1KYI5_PETCI|nr:hypothetical protein Pcinc_006314 [Petrolisthes cinctipes]